MSEQVDRGDFIDDEDVTLEDAAPVVEQKVEEPAVEEPKVEESGEEEERPRDDKGRFTGIPKARFDEAVGKEREAREAAERRAAELERQLAERQQTQAATVEIETLEAKVSELEVKYAQLLADGETEDAAKVRQEIRQSERAIARYEAQQDAKQTTSQILEAERFELAVAKLEAEHSFLNPKSEDYDAEVVEMILDRQASLVNRGTAPSKALTDATAFILKRLAPPAKTEEQGLTAAAKVDDRKAAQVAKNLDVQNRQPPSMKGVGLDSDKLGEKGLPSIASMTAEEFAALPEATKARLRGDLA